MTVFRPHPCPSPQVVEKGENVQAAEEGKFTVCNPLAPRSQIWGNFSGAERKKRRYEETKMRRFAEL